MSTSPHPTNSSKITPETMVGHIVAARPLLAGVFERVGIDFCCGGRITLAAACAKRGLDVNTFISVLEAVPSALTSATDAAAMSLTALADHIESTHHSFTKEELPVLVEQSQRVARKHSGRDARLTEVAQTVHAMAREMFEHMAKEEEVLFPLVRALDQNGELPSSRGSIADPISEMEAEHQETGAALERLRTLTDNFTPDSESCNTHRALLAGLARFEEDLHLHVHKENNILFPRALARLPANV